MPEQLTLNRVLYGLRMRESNGNYRAQSPHSSASGAYQYITSTWANYHGYARAADAPATVQDARARADRLAAWDRYHDWEKVIADHFYPAWANDKSRWNQVPGDPSNPTMRQYVDQVIALAVQAPADATNPDGEGILGVAIVLGALAVATAVVAHHRA